MQWQRWWFRALFLFSHVRTWRHYGCLDVSVLAVRLSIRMTRLRGLIKTIVQEKRWSHFVQPSDWRRDVTPLPPCLQRYDDVITSWRTSCELIQLVSRKLQSSRNLEKSSVGNSFSSTCRLSYGVCWVEKLYAFFYCLYVCLLRLVHHSFCEWCWVDLRNVSLCDYRMKEAPL